MPVRLVASLRHQPLGVLALVVTLALSTGAGVGYAAGTGITGHDVRNGTLTGADLARHSVKGSKLQPHSVTRKAIRNGSLTGASVKARSLRSSDLAVGTRLPPLLTGRVGPRTVQASDLAIQPEQTLTVLDQAFDVPAQGFYEVLVHPAGTIAHADACQQPNGTTVPFNVSLNTQVDGANLGTAGSGYPFDATLVLSGTVWLDAGTHHVSSTVQTVACKGTYPATDYVTLSEAVNVVPD
jgi:hypothetical protein